MAGVAVPEAAWGPGARSRAGSRRAHGSSVRSAAGGAGVRGAGDEERRSAETGTSFSVQGVEDTARSRAFGETAADFPRRTSVVVVLQLLAQVAKARCS